MKLLVVEDEKELRLSLIEGLNTRGYAVDGCEDGEIAELMAYENDYDLILLDLNLPKADGFLVLKNIRATNKTVNIIILTARGAIEDRVNGLDLGANDYLTKPFHFAELEARVRSLLRRRTIIDDVCIHCGDLDYDTKARKAFAKGMEIPLTNKEMALFEYFMLNQDTVITPQDLIEHIWDESVDEFSNSVRMHISSLRRKLKTQLGHDPIQNKIGKGYILSGKNEAKT